MGFLNKKNNKKFLALLLCGVIGLGTNLQTQAQTLNLPAEVKLDLEHFETIDEVTQNYPTSYYQLVNSDDKRVQRVKILEEPMQVDGEVIIDLPVDIVKVLRFFGDLRVVGGVSSNLKLTVINPKGKTFEWGGGTFGNGENTTKYFKTNSITNAGIGIENPLLVTDDNGAPIYEGYKLKLTGNGTLKDIFLWEEQGLIDKYDVTAWSIIGEDKPIFDVAVNVDITKNLSMEGEIKLDENKYKRLHMGSGPISILEMSGNTSTIDRTTSIPASEYGFYPGRGTIQFSYALEAKQGQQPKLQADKEKSGFTDYSYLDTVTQPNQTVLDRMNRLFPFSGEDYVITFNNWPSWMLENPAYNPANGTPAQEHFDAAAELSGVMVEKLNEKLLGNGPKYIEVKNESSLTKEWGYHTTDPENSWDILADFHNHIAVAVKEADPEALVGGPSTAHMALESSDFSKSFELLEFMDNTKGYMDFYSHHFYEAEAVVLNEEGNNTSGYADGRLEAIFSLFENHMFLTDNEKPILITEQGTLYDGGTDRDYWIKLKNYNTYMVKFMNMTDTVEMMVPYLYGVKSWVPNAKDTLYIYEGGSKLGEQTPMINYLDMWDKYAGAFVPVESNQSRVNTHAVLQGNKLYVAVNNMNPNRINIDLNIDTGDAKIVDVTRKHTYLEFGELVHEEIPVDDLSIVPMRVEETSVFEITLDKAPEFKETLYRKSYYGDKTLVPTGNTPIEFTLTCDTKNLGNSTLRINFGKDKSGFKEDLLVNVNGYKVLVDLSHTDQLGRIYTYVDLKIPTDYIKKENVITVKLPEEGGRIGNIELINDYKQEAPVTLDTLELKTQDVKAMWLRDSIAQIPTTGANKEAYDALLLAIEYAKEVCEYSLVTAEEITKATDALVKTTELVERTIFEKQN
ncbi:hypothetical protein AN641_03945 [Candidatus Epulonipiscioides gigas]|nr:hypothetical protein AN641_03945 [Epulopiscium sp. SCG-C07WGA-EpuloA2]